jgi:hypothetical protein
VPDADLLAYINQLTSSSAGTSDVSSIPTNYNFDFINPFDTTQQPMQMGREQDMNMNSMGMGPNGTISTGDFLSMLNQMNPTQQMPQQQQRMPPSTSNVLSQSMSGLYLGQQQPPMVMGDMGYDQSHSQPRSRDPMHNEYAYMLQQQQQQQQAHQTQQDPSKMYNPNPNLIDLSKPLDAGDVERILRALQEQQNGQPQQQQQQPMPQHPPRPPMQMHQQMAPQMMLPQHMPQYNMQQQPPPPPQDDLFDKFMLDPSPSAPETNGQSAGFDFNQMYGGINPNHVHSSMGMQMNGNGQNGSGSGSGSGQNGDQLTWDQLRLWAASHGMQAPPGPM